MKCVKVLTAILMGGLFWGASNSAWAAGGSYELPLKKVHNDLNDKASLQRGAGIYMNYCAGCHSLIQTRYRQVAQDIGIVDREGEVLEKLVQTHLNFTSDKVTDPIKVAMPAEQAEGWFGVVPPDLSLVTRSRGKHWLYSYLHGFYLDESRPWGVNNVYFPNVGMPHVLAPLQGVQTAVHKTNVLPKQGDLTPEKEVINAVVLNQPGELSPEEYDQVVTDLVNFLDYVGEPHQLLRKKIGVWVILFLVIFTSFAYLLKREYWKDVH